MCSTRMWDPIVNKMCAMKKWDPIVNKMCTTKMWDTIVNKTCLFKSVRSDSKWNMFDENVGPDGK